MSGIRSASDLLNRWRDGDQQAAAQLYELYSQKLTALASKNLGARLAPRVDAEDVVQSAFRTFFRRSAGGEFHINNSEQLWRLLIKITILKARTQARRHTAGMRDVNVETGVPHEMLESLAHDPTPQDSVILADQIEAILTGLPTAAGEILALRLEGHSKTEIAARMKVARQTVYRLLSLLQQRLERLLAEFD